MPSVRLPIQRAHAPAMLSSCVLCLPVFPSTLPPTLLPPCNLCLPVFPSTPPPTLLPPCDLCVPVFPSTPPPTLLPPCQPPTLLPPCHLYPLAQDPSTVPPEWHAWLHYISDENAVNVSV